MSRRRRDLLHVTKLAEFRAWISGRVIVENGIAWHYLDITSENPSHPYEVLRLAKWCMSGDANPIIFYRRDRGDHITCTEDGVPLVSAWLATTPRRNKKGKSA